MHQNFSDALFTLLVEKGFKFCFFVPGGNSMHLLDAARKRFECIPFVHEVSAVIGAEYANANSLAGDTFALLTAGPGLTNAVTGISGAWLESRELLIVGGQVKSVDLKAGSQRQQGIQEIDGVALVESVTKGAIRVSNSDDLRSISALVDLSRSPRKGPVFLEVPLDISGAPSSASVGPVGFSKSADEIHHPAAKAITKVTELMGQAKRPLFLVGQGLSKRKAKDLATWLYGLNVPVATSWTGADRVGFDSPNYVGRPNFFGMRGSNLIVQKSDLLVAIGARLGKQQIGFNEEGFAPNAKIVHVDIDLTELAGSTPKKELIVHADADAFVDELISLDEVEPKPQDWIVHCSKIMELFPLVETKTSPEGFWEPYRLINMVSKLLGPSDLVVSCSSGGTFTAFMQAFENKNDQIIVSNKGLASMGYGLAGAIGLSISRGSAPVVLFEGDGGFAQNFQELGTVSALSLPLKIFIFDNDGYASIRTSQRAHFDGSYLGCDSATGLGLPNWELIARSYGLRYTLLDPMVELGDLKLILESTAPEFIHVKVDPLAEYLPKIRSKVLEDGSMVSSPLHEMYPPISDALRPFALKYIDE